MSSHAAPPRRVCPRCGVRLQADATPRSGQAKCHACGEVFERANTGDGDKKWHLARNKQRYGPYNLEDLKKFAVDRTLGPDDMLLEVGRTKWIEATTIEGLFSDQCKPADTGAFSFPSQTPSVVAYETPALGLAFARLQSACRWMLRHPLVAASTVVFLVATPIVFLLIQVGSSLQKGPSRERMVSTQDRLDGKEHGRQRSEKDQGSRYQEGQGSENQLGKNKGELPSSLRPVSNPKPDETESERLWVIRSFFGESSIMGFRVGDDGKLYNYTTLFYVKDGTRCVEDLALIGNDRYVRKEFARVTILDGTYRGKSGWAIRKWLHKITD